VVRLALRQRCAAEQNGTDIAWHFDVATESSQHGDTFTIDLLRSLM
jgi:hypothetical protein